MEDYRSLIDSCIDCRNCWDVCPVTKVTGKENFTPQAKIQLLERIDSLNQEEIDNIYLSTRCGACDEVCPVDIPITDIIQHERSLLAKQGKEPARTTQICKNIMEMSNPGGKDPATRNDWITPDLQLSDSSDTAYMAGCWIALAHKDIGQATIRVLNAGGIKPRIMEEEQCCGLFLIDNGHMEEAAQHAKEYTEYIESLGIKKLIVSCPGCYKVLKEDYPELFRETEFEVINSMTIFKQMLEEGTLKPEMLDLEMGVRDACPMKNMNDLPRDIMQMIGIKVNEIFENKTVCCGAPAGLKPNFPDIAADIGTLTLDKTPDDGLASYCPFCYHHLEDVCKKQDRKLNMTDIALLLEKSINKK